MKKTTLLKKLILSREILVMPGAYDALSAKIIEQMGFQSLVVGGYATSASILGFPDVGLTTQTEMVDHTRRVAGSVNIPVFADGDTGHGNTTNVARTIREFERAGAAGLFIEDQVFPKRCGHMEGKSVIPAEAMIAKIKAAVDARSDNDFVIMARTDALATEGITMAIERSNRYREAGADMIFVEALLSKEQMKEVNTRIDAPTFASVVEGGKTPSFTARQFQNLGFSVVAYGLSTLFSAAWAVRRVLSELHRNGTTSNYEDNMISFAEFNRLMDIEHIRNLESGYDNT